MEVRSKQRQRWCVGATRGAWHPPVPPYESSGDESTDRRGRKAPQGSRFSGFCGRCPYGDTLSPGRVPDRTDIWRAGKITKQVTGRVFAGQAMYRLDRAIGLQNRRLLMAHITRSQRGSTAKERVRKTLLYCRI